MKNIEPHILGSFTVIVLGLGILTLAYKSSKRVPVVSQNKEHLATLFAAKACSCFGDTKLITFREKEFDFTCQDGISYGKMIPYSMTYSGEFCKP